MSKDNFCFIDDNFKRNLVLIIQKTPAEHPIYTILAEEIVKRILPEIEQGFKAAMLEEKEARIKQNKSFCGCPMCEHHSEPYEAQETLVNSKGDT